jgi:hypothetical protein
MTLLLTSVATASAAQLWDLIVSVKSEKSQINLNDKPVVFGTVLNQAMKPVPDADIRISFANISVNTKTDSDGNFRQEFENQTMSGLFYVNVYAKSGSQIGIAKTSIKIGEERPTFNEMYYRSNLYENTPLPNEYAKLEQKQYQKFVEHQNLQKQKQSEIELKMLYLQKQKNIAQQLLEDAIKERGIGAGILSDKDQNQYLAKVDPRARNAISAQLNYTKQIFAEAQQAMKEVLDNGGSLQDARKAYFEKLTVTKDELINAVDEGATENHSKVKTNEDRKINSKKVKGLTYNKNLK